MYDGKIRRVCEGKLETVAIWIPPRLQALSITRSSNNFRTPCACPDYTVCLITKMRPGI